jgi:hypothetical protein
VLFSSFPQIPIPGLTVRLQGKLGNGNEEIEIACPQAVVNYKKHMGVVDVSDQKREYYGVAQSANWQINISFKRIGRKRSLPIGSAFPNFFHTLQKNIRLCKRVCFVYKEKEKTSIRMG